MKKLKMERKLKIIIILKNYNCNNEWAKLNELDIDKAYKNYIDYITKNNN